MDSQSIPYEYKCRELSAGQGGESWCVLPPIDTRVSLTGQGREAAAYIREGYAFSPMFTLGCTGKLKEKEAFTTWLKLQKAN